VDKKKRWVGYLQVDLDWIIMDWIQGLDMEKRINKNWERR